MTGRLIFPHFLPCLIILAGAGHSVQNIDRLARQMPHSVGLQTSDMVRPDNARLSRLCNVS